MRNVIWGCAAVAALLLAGCGDSGAPEQTLALAEAPGAATKTFVNSREIAVNEILAASYVDFRFEYPADWSVDPATGQAAAANFVRVFAPQAPRRVDTASFTVGRMTVTGDPQTDAQRVPEMLGELEKQMQGSFPNFAVVSRGEAQIGAAAAPEFRFNSHVAAADMGQPGGEDFHVWGRAIAVPPAPGSRDGLLLVLLATSESDITSAADVGETGGLGLILDTFALGGA